LFALDIVVETLLYQCNVKNYTGMQKIPRVT
jgi:hypothetical protein